MAQGQRRRGKGFEKQICLKEELLYSSNVLHKVSETALFEVTVRRFFRVIAYEALQQELGTPDKKRAAPPDGLNPAEALHDLCLDEARWRYDTHHELISRHFLQQFRDYSTSGIEQRCAFAAKGELEALLPLILFETHPDICSALFRNPAVSVSMLQELQGHWSGKHAYPGDDELLTLLEATIIERQQRLEKISQVLNYAHHLQKVQSLFGLLSYLPDRDTEIANGARKGLQRADAESMFSVLHPTHAFWENKEFDPLLCWRITQALEQAVAIDSDNRRRLQGARLALLDFAMLDLHQPKRFFTMIAAHVHRDAGCRQMANDRLSVDELISLIQDDSFPRRMIRQTLRVFRYHPNIATQRFFADIANQLMEENRQRLRDMEGHIAALFDTIVTSNLMQQFDKGQPIAKDNGDLAYLLEAIHQLMDLPGNLIESFGYRNLASAVARDGEAQKIQLFWRATIGQFLGRIHRIYEAICWVWSQQRPDMGEAAGHASQLRQCNTEIETHHKKQVNCKLRISCNRCLKRTCAAESYLVKICYLTEELLEA